MKRFLAILILAAAVVMSASAELPDISGLTFEELVALRDQINLAIWSSQEWQEVTVPEGVWIIGEDIPAGHWTVRVAGKFDLCSVSIMDRMDPVTHLPEFGAQLLQFIIGSPGYSAFGEVTAESADFIMLEGWFFKCTGAVIFTPYAGKPDLGFK